MRPIFTIHAGEYYVGSVLEKKYKTFNIWIPSKDSGIDLLVTDQNNKKTVSIQVKFSKDFLPTHFNQIQKKKYKSSGWWSFNASKMAKSKADFWVLVLYSLKQKESQFIIVKPKDLYERLKLLRGNEKTLQCYFTVTNNKQSWETRGLKAMEKMLIISGEFKDSRRNFSEFLNNWDQIKERLK